MQKLNLFKLSEAGAGHLKVLAVEACTDPHVLRLCQLGLILGAKIELLKRSIAGAPLLLRVNHSVLCLDPILAEHFLVEPDSAATDAPK